MQSNNANEPRLDDLNQLGKRIQELVERSETLADPAARAMVHECIESVLGFYGQGLARVLKVVQENGAEGRAVYAKLIEDRVVSGLLLIHGLHPFGLEERLRKALDKVRPYMKSHGGDVELLNIEHDFAKLRLVGHCETCPSSRVTLELAVRQAIEEACPDLIGFDVEGAAPEPLHPNGNGHVPAEWASIQGAELIVDGDLMAAHAGAVPLVICKVGKNLYAYRDHCPVCNMPLHLGGLSGEVLTCRAGHGYNVSSAGLALGNRDIHLDPFPLLLDDGKVQVATAGSTP